MKHRLLWSGVVLGAWLSGVPLAGMAGCGDELPMSSDAKPGSGDASPEPVNPMLQLQSLAQEAVNRSARIGAAKLLAEASNFDVDEVRGASMPQVSINGALGPAGTKYKSAADISGLQSTAGLNVSGVLYDGGRLSSLTRWREELAKSALSGAQSAREQVVLEAISIAVERNRYKVQANVFQQQARKMSCLVEVLEQIVAEDKGRSSELVQARKTQAQAEVSRDSALAAGRQMELRLRKIIGDRAPVGEGIAVPLSETINRGEVLRLMALQPDVLQFRAQADAADQLASSVAARKKPQVNWMASSSSYSRGESKNVSVQAGVTVTYSLFNGGADQAAAMAAHKRAESARQQYEEFFRSLTSRVSEVHDSAISSQERAKKYVEILKDSDRVRMSTFQQWSQLGRRSLFDVMSAESDHFNLRVAYVNALHDTYQANVQLRALGGSLSNWLGLRE
jgi:adhesin transport system outer membrane protein